MQIHGNILSKFHNKLESIGTNDGPSASVNNIVQVHDEMLKDVERIIEPLQRSMLDIITNAFNAVVMLRKALDLYNYSNYVVSDELVILLRQSESVLIRLRYFIKIAINEIHILLNNTRSGGDDAANRREQLAKYYSLGLIELAAKLGQNI